MRDDMAKKLVGDTHRTTPRETYKTKRRTQKQKIRDPESLPKREGMKKQYGYDLKMFGEFFPPLIGYLRKNVGRPWDKVFSDLAKSLKGGGTVIDHVYVHLWQFVERNPKWIDGWPHGAELRYQGEHSPLLKGDLYVDRHGILREVKKHKPRPKGKMVDKRVVISELEQYRRIKGVWYHVWFKKVPETGTKGQILRDVLLNENLYWKSNWSGREAWHLGWRVGLWGLDNVHGQIGKAPNKRSIYAVRMFQIGKREIKQAGLNKA